MAETVMQVPEWIAEIAAFVLDMDGVLYRGDQMIPEVPAFLEALDDAGIPYMMATNNATATPEDYVRKLSGMGIDVAGDRIVTSALATGDYLRAHYERGASAYVVGMAALREAVFSDGYFVEATTGADVVVSGADFELTYESLKIACLNIRAGADYVATNADTTFPSEEGLIPGAGSIVAALIAAGGKDPVVVGKPSPVTVETCIERMGSTAARTVMLGDRLDTDILAGQRAGTKTVLVTTGISSSDDVKVSGIEPDLIVPTLDPLTTALSARSAAR